ncbi:MAG: hypothetical protein HOP10_12940 [Chitinophagaceae bacterium]|nr:hypothetical protein [Chitinophagaceae bacterium]
MKKTTAIFFFLLFPFLLRAQEDFETNVPGKPVVVGESFQVQYIFPGTNKITNFKAPVFRSFRFISGPNQYTGSVNSISGKIPVVNFVFTIEATRAGRFNIPGATATINGKPVQCDDAFVEVISVQQSKKTAERGSFTNSDYVLRPGEDPYEKIRQNLFLKVMVDRNTCFAGEPILATFKLYSRLQSTSDIVKNPGFYGFTVYDMVNLADKEMVTEEVNGKLFDVHTIRKVQLFPLQEGVFTIDAMEVINKVEFSRSVVNKKTEQEITEGVLNDEEEILNENTELYETKMNTAPVLIRVKALPNKPVLFDGAVGHFSISSSLIKNKIAKNEEGVFEIIISGQGNFTQLNAPVIQWPKGIEGFEPTINDAIDKTQMPLKGTRTFRYSFTCTKESKYQLPAVELIYFNPGGSYKTISSSPVIVEVGPEEKKNIISKEKKISITATNASASKIAAIIVVSLVVIVMIYWLRYKKAPETVKEENEVWPSIQEFLAPAYSVMDLDDKQFYAALHQSAWDFFIAHFHLSGSDINKEKLISKMKAGGIADENIAGVDNILKKCEVGMFTQANIAENKEELLRHTEEVLKKISSDLFKPT